MALGRRRIGESFLDKFGDEITRIKPLRARRDYAFSEIAREVTPGSFQSTLQTKKKDTRCRIYLRSEK